MDPLQLRALVRRWALPVIALAVVGALTAFLVTRAVKPLYRSQGIVEVLAPTRSVDASLALPATEIITTDASLMTLPKLLDRVSAELHLGVPGSDLQSEVTVTARKDTQLLDVSVLDPDAHRAQRIANTLMTDFVQELTAQNQAAVRQTTTSLDPLVASMQAQVQRDQAALNDAKQSRQDTSGPTAQLNADNAALAQLTTAANGLRASQAQNFESVRVASPAGLPGAPASPDRRTNTILGGLAGLLIGLSLAVLLQYLDQGLRNEDDVRQKLGLPTLGVVPRYHTSGRRRGDRASEFAAEAYRRLRTNILFSGLDRPLSSILITSARQGEGKTRTAANLAGVVAASGQRVLLVDADMRRPSQHRLFGRPLAAGVSDMLLSANRAERMELNGSNKTRFDNLSLLAAGTIPPNPSELLASRQTPGILRQLEQKFDLVVVDTPPVDVVTDALSIARHASATVVVIEAGRTNVRQAQRAIGALRGVGANVIGVALNKSRRRDLRSYYGYYYGYEAKDAAAAGPAAKGAPIQWSPIEEVTPAPR